MKGTFRPYWWPEDIPPIYEPDPEEEEEDVELDNYVKPGYYLPVAS